MIELYGHPFAAFAWKALIAAYERDVPFTFHIIDPDHPDNMVRIAELSPTGQFPAIVDGEVEVTQSNAVIAYLDRVGSAPPLVPEDRDTALRARMLAEIFDNYVSRAVTDIVFNALRAEADRDPLGERNAHETLDKSLAWLAGKIAKPWAAGELFTIADCAAAPSLFYADWVHSLPEGLRDYRTRLLERPSVARVVNEARPYRHLFPLPVPERD